MREIEELVDSISKIEFRYGKRRSDQYIYPISAVLRSRGFYVVPEYGFSAGYLDIYAKKGRTVICIEIDYKTVKYNSIRKIERMWDAIPIFVLTYEGDTNIQESLRRIPFRPFYLVDLYNHDYYSYF